MASTVTVNNSLVEIISADRSSAWNRAAMRTYTDETPEQIIRKEGLDFPVWKETLTRNHGVNSGYEAVVGKYKGHEIVYGATKDYSIVHIDSLLHSLNEIPYKVESALALNRGRFIAVNYNYGKMDIAGEPYNMGITIVHPYHPGHAWRIMVTPIRLYCMNAIIAAKRESVSDVRVWHRSPAQSKIDIAMVETKAELLVNTMRESLEKLASIYIAGDELKLLTKVYGDTAAGVVVANLYRRFEVEYPNFKGTAYALYQATCEAEDYRPVRKNQSEQSIAESALIGTRAMKKVQMYDALIGLN